MKGNFFKLVIFLAVLALAACSKGPDEQPNDGGNPKNCNNKGKFERVVCGTGVYGDYWIRLENGTLLKPCKSDASLLDINSIYEGMSVELGYYGVKNSDCATGEVQCLAALPEHETVNISCIKATGTPRCPEPGDGKCDHSGILYDWHNKLDGCGWVIKLNTGEVLEVPDSQIDATQFEDETPVLVGFTRVYRASICMAGTPVDLTCIRVANTIQK